MYTFKYFAFIKNTTKTHISISINVHSPFSLYVIVLHRSLKNIKFFLKK